MMQMPMRIGKGEPTDETSKEEADQPDDGSSDSNETDDDGKKDKAVKKG